MQDFFHQPYDYWDIYYINLVQDFFHEQYTKNLDTSQGFSGLHRTHWIGNLQILS